MCDFIITPLTTLFTGWGMSSAAAGAAATIAAGGLGAAAAGSLMPKPQSPGAPAPPPTPKEGDALQAKDEERKRNYLRMGMAKTVKTSGQGDLSSVSIMRPAAGGEMKKQFLGA